MLVLMLRAAVAAWAAVESAASPGTCLGSSGPGFCGFTGTTPGTFGIFCTLPDSASAMLMPNWLIVAAV